MDTNFQTVAICVDSKCNSPPLYNFIDETENDFHLKHETVSITNIKKKVKETNEYYETII